MMKYFKFVVMIVFMLLFSNVGYCSYINNQDITFRSLILDSRVASLVYNVFDSGDEYHTIGGPQRYFGIHNMQVRVPGYEPIDLVKDDFCEYPHLFTIIGNITPDHIKENFITQRSALVKYFLPLHFGFEVKDGVLKIMSALSPYSFFAPMMATQDIKLLETKDFNDQSSKKHIEVYVNGRGILLDGQVLQLFHTNFISSALAISLYTVVSMAALAIVMQLVG